MARDGGSSFFPILVLGGIGYYLYSSGFFSSLFAQSSSAVASGVIPPPPVNPNPSAATTTPQTPSNPMTTAMTTTTTTEPTKPVDVTCPPGVSNVNGVCDIGTAIMRLGGGNYPAGGNLLSFDEWCYYFQQVTSMPCPIDPSTITDQQWTDAGVQGANRSTPIPYSTWRAFMQLLAPSAGISGLGRYGGRQKLRSFDLGRLGSRDARASFDLAGLGSRDCRASFDLAGLGCECDSKKDPIFKGLGQILNFEDFFSQQPHRHIVRGNFR